MEKTLAEARSEKMWEHEGQDLLILGEFALKSGNKKKAREYLQEAIQSEKRVGLVRVIREQSYLFLSQISEEEGEMEEAEMISPTPFKSAGRRRYRLPAAHIECNS